MSSEGCCRVSIETFEGFLRCYRVGIRASLICQRVYGGLYPKP